MAKNQDKNGSFFYGYPEIDATTSKFKEVKHANSIVKEFIATRQHPKYTHLNQDYKIGTQTYTKEKNGAIQLKSETIYPSAGLSVHVNHVTHNNVMKTTTFENGFPAQTKIFSSAGALLETQKHDIVTREKSKKRPTENETTLGNAQARLEQYQNLEEFSDRAPPLPEYAQLGFMAKFCGIGG